MYRPLLAAALLAGAAAAQGLPRVPAPPQNPITPQKAVLGKMLFWEEQLSTDDSMACGTCHMPTSGGADPVVGIHPGRDGRRGTPDDKRASFGVAHQDANGDLTPDPVFDFDRQVSRRTAQSAITSQFSRSQFWDGRATNTFTDPLTGQVVIPGGGSLEHQSLMPIMNTAEMGKEGRTWQDVVQKLQNARPMALATILTPDVQRELASDPGYPELFRRAFGDGAITPVRIAFAIATYERTLVGDQTPWDRFVAGNPNAMTRAQQRGFNAFRQSRCDRCHTPPFFTDHTFRNIGLRPIVEDTGRQEVTNNPGDRGRFKVPSLRHVGLKATFMHTGQFDSFPRVFDFYDGRIPGFRDNRDPLIGQIRVPGNVRQDLQDFIQNALTDPRVRDGLPPFDRPTLRSEQPGNGAYGLGAAGTAGIQPRLVSFAPAFPGSDSFKVGLVDGLGASPAIFALSLHQRTYPNLPVPVNIDLDLVDGFAVRLAGVGPGTGYATLQLSIPANPSLKGISLFFQGFVSDPAGPVGLAATRGVECRIDSRP